MLLTTISRKDNHDKRKNPWLSPTVSDIDCTLRLLLSAMNILSHERNVRWVVASFIFHERTTTGRTNLFIDTYNQDYYFHKHTGDVKQINKIAVTKILTNHRDSRETYSRESSQLTSSSLMVMSRWISEKRRRLTKRFKDKSLTIFLTHYRWSHEARNHPPPLKIHHRYPRHRW